MSSPPPSGIYVPVPTFFTGNDEVDVKTTGDHAVRLAKAGITGLVVLGSTGEAVFVNDKERRQLIKIHREALNKAGFQKYPLIVGAGGQSVRETLQLAELAKDAGADYVICITPGSYFASGIKDADYIRAFKQIADKSALPVVIYNFPGVTNGINLSSDVLKELAQHPNIVGVKLTEFDTGKCARVALAVDQKKFAVFSGVTDNLTQVLAVNAAGSITGLANIAPKLCVALYNANRKGDHQQVRKLQLLAAEADKIGLKYGIVGTKVGMQKLNGYGGKARSPLPEKLEDGAWENDLQDIMSRVMEVENSL